MFSVPVRKYRSHRFYTLLHVYASLHRSISQSSEARGSDSLYRTSFHLCCFRATADTLLAKPSSALFRLFIYLHNLHWDSSARLTPPLVAFLPIASSKYVSQDVQGTDSWIGYMILFVWYLETWSNHILLLFTDKIAIKPTIHHGVTVV